MANFKLVFEAGPVAVASALVLAAVFLWYLWKAGALPLHLRVLRLAAVLCLIFCMLQPALLLRTAAPEKKPRLAVLLDASASMKQIDGAGGKSRFSKGAELLFENRQLIDASADPVYFTYQDKAKRRDLKELPGLKAADSPSNLSAALFQVLNETGRKPDRVWVVTDGISQADNNDPLPEANGTEVDFIGAGNPRSAAGIYLKEARSPDFVFLHIPFTISASWQAVGLAREKVTVCLLDQNGRNVAESTSAPVSDFELMETTLTAKAEGLGPGRFRLVIKPGSKKTKSAARDLVFQTIREKYRIIYIAGKPSFEYAALRELLKSDPAIDLVSFVILREENDYVPVGDSEMSLIPFPIDEIFVKDIGHFDVFILQDFSFAKFHLPLQYQLSLKEFVRNGGGLLISGGSNAFASGGYAGTPLEEILPVALSPAPDYRPGLIGVRPLEHPVALPASSPEESARLWSESCPLDGYNLFGPAKKGASVILETGGETSDSRHPLLASIDLGKGKVMALASPSTWRWKLSGGTNWRMSSFYRMFWTRVLQYLSGSLELKRVQLSVTGDSQAQPSALQATLRVLNGTFSPLNDPLAGVKAYWQTPASGMFYPEFRMTEPGIYKAELSPPALGLNKIRAVVRSGNETIGGDELRFRWDKARAEVRLPEHGFLAQLALQNKGRFAALDNVRLNELLKNLPVSGSDSGAVYTRKSLWDRTGWFILIAVLLLVEWFLRRWQGYS